MKKIVSIISAVIVSMLILTGCKTPPSSGFDINKAAATVELSANLGSYYAIQKSPDNRKYFVLASQTIGTLLNDPTVTSAKLEQSLIAAVGSTNVDAVVAIKGAVGVYSICFRDAVAGGITQNVAANTLLAALKLGIDEGIASTTPPQVTRSSSRSYRLN